MVMIAFGPVALWTLPVIGFAAAAYGAAKTCTRTRYRLYRSCGFSRTSALLHVALVRRPQ